PPTGCGPVMWPIGSRTHRGFAVISGFAKTVAALAVIGVALFHGAAAKADGCPTAASEIDTDRPDTTNSSETVPAGSLQLENGINIADWPNGPRLDGTSRRIRLGLVDCGEVLVDLPDYRFSPKSGGVRGFTSFSRAA